MQQQHISFDLFFTSLLPHRRRSQTTTSDMTCISITKSLFCFTRHSVVFPFSETRMSFGLRLFFFSFPCLSLFSCSALFDLRQEFRLSSLSFERRQKEASFSFDASISSFLLSTSLTPILLVAVFFTIRQHLHAEEVYPDKNKEYPRVDALTKFDHVFLVVSFSFSCCYFFILTPSNFELSFFHTKSCRSLTCAWHPVSDTILIPLSITRSMQGCRVSSVYKVSSGQGFKDSLLHLWWSSVSLSRNVQQ